MIADLSAVLYDRYSRGVDAPGKLLGVGRDADVFEYGNGAVLRRSRKGRSQLFEARVMQFVRAQGFPVPEVLEVSEDGVDMVMERIEGPTMVQAASTQPWKLRRFGSELAQLHEVLHGMSAPEWMPAAPCGIGSQLLHMDLHPLNVMISRKGPMVIDWPGAARGDPLIDVAATWVLLASANAPGGRLKRAEARIGRQILLQAFLRPFPRTDLESVVATVVEWKCQNPNMTAGEIDRMRSMLSVVVDDHK